MFKLTGRGEQRRALVASNRSTGRTSSYAQVGPRVWVLGDIPQSGLPMETNFPTGFLCDPYLPENPRSGLVARPYSPQSLGDNWGVTHGQNRDGTHILPREGARILSGSPQLRHMEWDDWAYDLGRFDGWPTGGTGPGTAEVLDPIGSVQYDSQVHPLYGDLTTPGNNLDERQARLAGGTVLEAELYGAACAGAVVEEKEIEPLGNPWALGGWDSWYQYGQ